MLNIVFGRENCEEFNLDSRMIFRQNKKPEWFQDPFVEEFIKAVDVSEVLFEEVLKDRLGHGISTDVISTGCKTLCCIYYLDGWFYGSLMGNNCIPFLLRIAKQKNVNIMLEHCMDFSDEDFANNDICVNGKRVGPSEYEDLYAAWCASVEEEDQE